MGLILDRIYNACTSNGQEKPARILMLGLDAAGKTTILYRVKLGQTLQTTPNTGFTIEMVNPCSGVTFILWDIGGQKQLRYLWHFYHPGAEGLIFVVDSNDSVRLEEARIEFQEVLKFPYMSNVPIVIIANKQDLPNAMKSPEIIDKLGLNDIHTQHKWSIQSACATTGEGLLDAMLVMANLVKQYRKENK